MTRILGHFNPTHFSPSSFWTRSVILLTQLNLTRANLAQPVHMTLLTQSMQSGAQTTGVQNKLLSVMSFNLNYKLERQTKQCCLTSLPPTCICLS